MIRFPDLVEHLDLIIQPYNLTMPADKSSKRKAKRDPDDDEEENDDDEDFEIKVKTAQTLSPPEPSPDKIDYTDDNSFRSRK